MEAADASAPSAPDAAAAPFTCGADGALGGSPFEGTFDELAIYDHVLPCARVRAHLAAAKLP